MNIKNIYKHIWVYYNININNMDKINENGEQGRKLINCRASEIILLLKAKEAHIN